MKKSAMTIKECIKRLEATADALVSEGADPSSIMGVLVKVMVRTALKTRNPAADLDLAANVLLNAAERASEQAKKDRADKRAKRLGLTDD
jgi:hypothetical protein